MKPRRLAALFLLVALALPARALILTGERQPVSDPGWPAGAAKLAGAPTRLFYAEGPPFGGGEWTFFNAGDTAALQTAVDAFAAVVASAREIRLHPGHPRIPYATHAESELPPAYDWSFTVWQTERWEKLLGPGAPAFMAGHPDFGGKTPPLRLDVWVHPGGPDWKAVRIPAGVDVFDGRAEAHGHRADRLTLKVRLDPRAGPTPKGTRIELRPDGEPGSPSRTVASASIPDGQDSVTVADLEPGRYRIVATAPGRAGRIVGTTAPDGDTYIEVTASLDPEATVSGTVVDSDGKGIPGVEVAPFSLLGGDLRAYELPVAATTTTDASGRFELRGLPEGRLQIRATKPGLHQVWNPRESTALPASGLEIRMNGTGTVRAHVGQGGTAHIQEAARTGVGSWGGSGNADAEGWVTIRDIPVGEYVLSRQPIETVAPGGSRVTVQAGRTAEIRLDR